MHHFWYIAFNRCSRNGTSFCHFFRPGWTSGLALVTHFISIDDHLKVEVHVAGRRSIACLSVIVWLFLVFSLFFFALAPHVFCVCSLDSPACWSCHLFHGVRSNSMAGCCSKCTQSQKQHFSYLVSPLLFVSTFVALSGSVSFHLIFISFLHISFLNHQSSSFALEF